MDEIILASLAIKAVVAAAGVYGGLLFLRHLDRRAGFEWQEKVVPGFEAVPMAAGLYLGLRFLGVCHLVGSLLQ